MRSFITIILLGFLASCKCLPIPTHDSTAPTISYIVEYPASTGRLESLTVNATELPKKLVGEARPGSTVTVAVIGTDEMGMRSLAVEESVTEYEGDLASQTGPGLLSPDELDCPKEHIVKDVKVNIQKPTTVVIKSSAKNWMNMQTNLQQPLTIELK